MRTGYSNFLGEYVPADVVDYGDCADFQIVCPCCREPTFKTKRPAAAGEVHYLSHYPSAEAGFSDCENRVASLSRDHVGASNAVARKQRLDWFMSVVPDEIYQGRFPTIPDLRPAVMAQTALSEWFCDVSRQVLGAARMARADRYLEIWKAKDEDLALTGSPFAGLSSLGRSVRSRTAFDVETTLYADPSGEAYRKVFCSAVAMMAVRCLAEMRKKQASPMDRLVWVSVGKMLTMDPVACREYMRRILRAEAKDADGVPMQLMEAFSRRIDGEIHYALCGIDYVELMRKRQVELRPEASVAAAPDVEEAPVFGM